MTTEPTPLTPARALPADPVREGLAAFLPGRSPRMPTK